MEPKPHTTTTRLDEDPGNIQWALNQARFISFCFGIPHLIDDCQSVALVALVESARRFDPTRNVQFRNYVRPRIKGAIQDLCRAEMPKGYTRSNQRKKHGFAPTTGRLSAAISGTGGEDFIHTKDMELSHTIESGELPVGWEIESEEEVDRISRSIGGDSRDGQFLRLMFLHARFRGLQKLVAREIGLSEQRISQIYWRIKHVSTKAGIAGLGSTGN